MILENSGMSSWKRPRSFSCQAIVSSLEDAETISMSPSASMSAAKTLRAASALVAMLAAVQLGVGSPVSEDKTQDMVEEPSR